MTTKLAPEQLMEDKDNQWILGSPMITSRIGSLSVPIVTSMAIWQKNDNWRRKNKKHGCVLNITRRGILPKIAKENRQ